MLFPVVEVAPTLRKNGNNPVVFVTAVPTITTIATIHLDRGRLWMPSKVPPPLFANFTVLAPSHQPFSLVSGCFQYLFITKQQTQSVTPWNI